MNRSPLRSRDHLATVTVILVHFCQERYTTLLRLQHVHTKKPSLRSPMFMIHPVFNRLQLAGEIDYSLSQRSYHITLLRGLTAKGLAKVCVDLYRTLARAEASEAEKVESAATTRIREIRLHCSDGESAGERRPRPLSIRLRVSDADSYERFSCGEALVSKSGAFEHCTSIRHWLFPLRCRR